MRKIYVLSFLLLVFVVKSVGQMTLVTSFDGVDDYVSKITNIDGSTGFIVNNGFELTVYNEDFSFNRTIKPVIPNFEYIEDISRYNRFFSDHQLVVSTHLFNDNATVEFLVHLHDESTGKVGFAIVDENNNILFSKYADVGVSGFDFSLMTTSNKVYLSVIYKNGNYTQPSKTEIYSLPGSERFDGGSSSSSISDVKSVIGIGKVTAFPNPSKTTVNLSYSLPDNSRGTLSVYDLSGKCLKTMKVDGAFPYVTLDVTDYASATYIYKVESNGTSVSEKFIVSK